MPPIQNIAAYKFTPLTDLRPLRTRLMEAGREWSLKGTILISTEGINLFVAGTPDSVSRLMTLLRLLPGLADLTPKYSETDHQPFSRYLVRIKREIIAFGVEGINPAENPAPKIQAATLRQWLDEGRPLTLLDTRNDYEVKLGTFKNALPLGIDHFRDFPGAVRKLPEEMKEGPIVMFCTGGIRCEKAGPFMEREGFKHILQLEGGILKYFEECGGAHYEGECFVFDKRVGVDPCLHETDSIICFKCQTPLTGEEQKDPRYVRGVSCPACYRTPESHMQTTLARRQESISRLASPPPGRIPYDNDRPFKIPAPCDGMPFLEAVQTILPRIPRQEWENRQVQGLLLDPRKNPVPADRTVRAGETYVHRVPGLTEPEVNMNVRILHEDEALVVLDKPAPLPMHPGGRFNRNTLQFLLDTVYHPQKPHPAHRLDANTTGVLLITRRRHFAARLQPQFESGTVAKIYLVRVNGHPEEDSFCCDAPISSTPSALGLRTVDRADGLKARTEFKVLNRHADGTSLLEARPLTGRTNQIRVHLWHLGLPVCGDPAYLKDGAIGGTQTLSPGDPPLCLHAWKISFLHPLDMTPCEMAAPIPPHLTATPQSCDLK
ncbi:MAG: pseudouridine synthase [Verrucomicrobiae bacterium]|nr:pseudouridine synthase [Verrucomicrobiae bacterium]